MKSATVASTTKPVSRVRSVAPVASLKQNVAKQVPTHCGNQIDGQSLCSREDLERSRMMDLACISGWSAKNISWETAAALNKESLVMYKMRFIAVIYYEFFSLQQPLTRS